MSYVPIYHRQPFQSETVNTTKSMVGIFPLAPHHDYLQYMYHVYLMQTGLKTGVLHFPPPSTTLSSVLYKIEQK